MSDKSASRGRANAARLTLGTVLVGAGVLASCNVVNAAPIGYADPYIAKVNHQSGFNGGDGLEHFQTDSWNVGIFVNPGLGGARAHGDLAVKDTANGDVLCELPAKVVEDSLASCPAFFGPGERTVVAQFTDHGKTITTDPVVIESYAEEAPADGVAPHPISVVGTAPGDAGGATAVTLQGTPGDRVILRDQRYYDLLDTTFDASGRVVAQALVPEGKTESLPYETQRDGQRTTGTIDVTGDPKPYTRAEPLQFVALEKSDDGSSTVVLRGTPGAWYLLQLHSSTVRTAGTVPEDGIIRWELDKWTELPSGLSFHTRGDDGHQISGDVDLTATEPVDPEEPGEPADPVVSEPEVPVDPGFTIPVVAEPAPGEVDPGFTAPVVAEPAPGEVDPGFTAPGGQAGRDAVSVVGVEPSKTADVAHVSTQGAAGDRVNLETTDHRFFWAGSLDQDGHASFDVWDFPAGTEKTFRGEVRRGEATLPVEFTVTSNARKPVTAEKLEQVSVEHGADGTTVTYRGTPGARYSLFAVASGQADGTIPEDGLVHLTMQIPNGQTRVLSWSTFGDAGYHSGEDRITGPTTEPVVAEPNPGETDPGFTVPGHDGEQPGDGDDGGQPVVAEPNPGATDPGFTVPGNDGGQPGDGNEDGDDSTAPAPQLTAELSGLDGRTGRGTLRVQDSALSAGGDYYAQVWIDGTIADAVRVTGKATDTVVEVGKPGAHTMEIKRGSQVLQTLQYTVPEPSGDEQQGATLEAKLLVAANAIGLQLSDREATGRGYTVRIFVDGLMRDVRTVTNRVTTQQVPMSGPGEHVLEVRSESGTVLKTLTFTTPGKA